MDTVMGIDNQDLVSKMEGFAVQGMKEECTGDTGAKMQWAYYFRNIVQWYQSSIECASTTCWKSLSNKEFKKLHLEREEKLKSGEIIDRRCHTQSDKGTKCRSAAIPATTHRKHYKSAETIEDSEASDEELPDSAAHDTELPVPGDDFIPFDCDKVLADLDQIFGPAPMLE
ncbi:hypothetical protein BDR03DRAFT_1019711 [Suillus americanus]|nr:hypothetical protein BDR03DRAFT_1019711 [Suillus americanus]